MDESSALTEARSDRIPPDIEARRLAGSPGESFLVQAPAGSGKTTLLVQRFLQLLGHVRQPEEILAITFTRKAANEMRRRVLTALAEGTDSVARVALKRNSERRWELLENPQRLKVQTIDSFAYSLVQRLPYASRLGLDYQTLDSADSYYEEATRRVLQGIVSPFTLNPEVIKFLALFDNNYTDAFLLLKRMLERRDQWMEIVQEIIQAKVGGEFTSQLAEPLADSRKSLVETQIASFTSQLPTDIHDKFLEVCEFAALNQGVSFVGLSSSQDARHVAGCFLTADAKAFRKRVDKRIGFPPGFNQEKETWETLRDELESLGLLDALRRLHALPNEECPLEEIRRLEILAVVLVLAVLELTKLFESQKVVDFTELAAGALRALETRDEPTELIQALDYRISHILVDEFQDTSRTQLRLFEALTSGWSPNDGNTFFAVGDPVQSIYRFRNADVGIFLNVRQFGMANRALKNIELEVNFRSAPRLVQWTNEVYKGLFRDRSAGAVPFSAAQPNKDLEGEVSLVVVENDPYSLAQAKHVAARIRELRCNGPDASVALLVRSRNKLPIFFAAMQRAQVVWKGVDIEPLSDAPVVRDLHSIVCALSDETDRLAWLSLFRSPLCGLELPVLEEMAAKSTGSEMLNAKDLPITAQPAVTRIRLAFEAARSDSARTPRSVVERLWFQLGGSDAYQSPDAVTNAERYLDLLESWSIGSINPEEVWTRATQLYASQQAADADVEVMTIHRSKGLEFDHVLIPDLDHGPPPTPRELLLWKEQGDSLLMATRGESGENTLYEWLRSQNREEDASESKRLLYVATTRAIRSLSLFASMSKGIEKPTPGSLFAALYPHMNSDEVEVFDSERVVDSEESAESIKPMLTRLKSDYLWDPSNVPSATDTRLLASSRKLSASDVGPIGARVEIVIGNLIHRALYDIGLSPKDPYLTEERKKLWKVQLRHEGLEARDVDWAISSATNHIKNVLEDPEGRWILFGDHEDSGFERSYTAIRDGQQTEVILDRTLIDSNGTRWIIDYKTAERGPDTADLLQVRDEGYERQLRLYAETVSATEPRPIRAALYFTNVPVLVEYPLKLG